MAQSLDYNLIDGEVVFNSAVTKYISSVMLDATHVIVTYADAEAFGTSIIGTVDGATITWGNEYVFNSGNTTQNTSVALDSTHVMISYNDQNNSGYGTSIIATVSGDTITFGSEYVFNSGYMGPISSVMLDSTHVMVSYIDWGNSGNGTAIIATISGDVISFGNEYVFSGTASYISSDMLDDTHVMINYDDQGNSSYGTSRIGTISGNVISFGDEFIFYSGTASYISSVRLDPTHVIISYTDTNYGTSIIGTIDVNTITWGSPHVFNNSGYSAFISSVMIDSTYVCVSYRDITNASYGTSIVGTISGDTITWGSSYLFNSGSTDFTSSVMLDSSRICVSYNDDDNSGYGTSIIGIWNDGEVVIPENPYIRPDNITGLYNLSHRGNLRGKAREGFVRPTIGQYFTSKEFEEIEAAGLVRTLDNPNTYNSGLQDRFGTVVAMNATYTIVGSPNMDDSVEGVDVGRAYVYNNASGELIHILDNPSLIPAWNSTHLTRHDYYGGAVAISDSYVAVGAYNESAAGSGSDKLQSGAVYIFSLATGNLVRTIANPNYSGTHNSDAFGKVLALTDTRLVVGVKSEDPGGQLSSGVVYVFNPVTGANLQTIVDPNNYDTPWGDYFGGAVTIMGDYIIAGAHWEGSAAGVGQGVVYVFDINTFALLHTIDSPTPGTRYFGEYTIESNDTMLVVDHQAKLYVIDSSDWQVKRTILNPNHYGTETGDGFGQRVSVSGNYIIVGCSGEDSAEGADSGVIYIFELSTGDLKYTFENPNAYATVTGDYFGTSVAITGNQAVGCAMGEAGFAGKGYVFKF